MLYIRSLELRCLITGSSHSSTTLTYFPHLPTPRPWFQRLGNLRSRRQWIWCVVRIAVGALPVYSGKESACQCRRRRRCRFDSLIGKIPLSRKQQPTPVFLPGGSHGQRSLVGYSQWDRKESDTTEQLSTHTHEDSCHRTVSWTAVISVSSRAGRGTGHTEM